MPGINRMLEGRCSSHASATCIGVTLSLAATADSVDDCSGVKPPSGKNSNVKGWVTWSWMLTAWAANGEQRGPFLAPDPDNWRNDTELTTLPFGFGWRVSLFSGFPGTPLVPGCGWI